MGLLGSLANVVLSGVTGAVGGIGSALGVGTNSATQASQQQYAAAQQSQQVGAAKKDYTPWIIGGVAAVLVAVLAFVGMSKGGKR